MEVEAAASGGGGGGGGGGGSGGGESSKRPVEHSCPAAEAAEQAAKRARGADPGARPEVEEPEGVNGMLVRSLGWVQLPSDKEQMVRDVTSALDSLGCRYSIERGELCNVVTATRDFGEGEAVAGAASGTLSVEHGDTPPPPDGTPYAQGQLTVRLRLHPNSIDSSTSDLCACWSDPPPPPPPAHPPAPLWLLGARGFRPLWFSFWPTHRPTPASKAPPRRTPPSP